MSILNTIRENKGQTLLEVMVGLSIAILIISAIVVSVINALNNEQFGVSQNQATQLAQEGVDYFRDLSQSDWASFITYSASSGYCLAQNSLTPETRPATGCTANAGLKREIYVELNSTSCLTPTPPVINNARVTARVKWTDGKCSGSGDALYCHKTEVISCMFKPFTNSSP